jgi:hypothetical protein
MKAKYIVALAFVAMNVHAQKNPIWIAPAIPPANTWPISYYQVNNYVVENPPIQSVQANSTRVYRSDSDVRYAYIKECIRYGLSKVRCENIWDDKLESYEPEELREYRGRQ